MPMKRKTYEAPELTLCPVAVERGFAASAEDWADREVDIEWDEE